MSAQPTAPAATDLVNVEIDGKKVQVAKGSMIIQASDAAGIAVPRFCYHKKLPIAANCRMCLVDVEKMPKPAPACATPVMEGMVVRTQAPRALSAQRNVMEFLLVNHPLDCPICDQGGECELQDVAMGYGRSVSRFAERKRTVADEDFGSLVASDMTRCIHCTRCVRFMDEIAGTQELGGMSRGEHLEIGTYTGKPLASELSGNVIDVCPVGALTNKVFRYRARAWELIAREALATHDGLHSNVWLHTRRGEVLRVVPRDNEAVNECWLSDRDRYAHQGLYHADRLTRPRIKRNGQWQDVEWDDALAAAAQILRSAGAGLGALLSPGSSCEDGAALRALLSGLGSERIDHRLRSLEVEGAEPGLSAPLAAYEQAKVIVLIGSHPRLDQPLLGHRIRKAWKRGANVLAINPVDFEFNFDLQAKVVAPGAQLPAVLAAVLARVQSARAGTGSGAAGDTPANAVASVLAQADVGSVRVLVGDWAPRHPQAATLRGLARALARSLGAGYDETGDGSNAVGLRRVGATHGGGMAAVLQSPVLWLQGVEAADAGDPLAFGAALQAAREVVVLSAYSSPELLAKASVLLPLALPAESAGTYVNLEGRVQTNGGGAKPPGDARPGWRVLRALAQHLGLAGFDYTDLAQLTAQISAQLSATPERSAVAEAATTGQDVSTDRTGLELLVSPSPYALDAQLRRAPSLAGTAVAASRDQLQLHPLDATRLGLADDQSALIGAVRLPVRVNPRVPVGTCWVETQALTLPANGSLVQPTGVQGP